MYPSGSLHTIINEEISLEGLEGSTLETLWNQLAIRLRMRMPLPQCFTDSVWPLVANNSEYEFYQLKEPRRQFAVFDRRAEVDTDTGIPVEPRDFPGHRFVYNPISSDGIRGSCEEYMTRTPISRDELKQLTWMEVDNRYGRTFVIVTSQRMRESFLIDQNCTFELTLLQYCMLEWIARSRYNGETSHGKYSLLEMTRDSSVLFYNRKLLTNAKLITRQSLCIRSGHASIQGMVMHLPRYYNEMKSKQLLLTERVVNELKQRKNFMADYDEIKHMVLGKAEAKKWFRTPEFLRFVKMDESVTYRTIFPDAARSDWLSKRGEEKMIRVMRLIHPTANVYDLWYREDMQEDEVKDGFLNSSNSYIDLPVLQQAYNLIANSSDNGLSQSSLASALGLDRLNARGVVKNLLKLKAVEHQAVDEGRQRTSKYFIPGKSLKAGVFDKEAQQFLTNHMNVQEQQMQLMQRMESPKLKQQEPEDREISLLTTDDSSFNESCASTSAQPSSLVGDSLPIEEDNDESIKTKFKENLHLYAEPTTVLDSIQATVVLTDKVNFLKKAAKGFPSLRSSKTISARLLHRCNFIVQLVRQYQVIEPRLILKKINREEVASGYLHQACNKSILRLISKLAADKMITIANVTLKRDEKEFHFAYACDLKITPEHSLLKSKVEASKARIVLQCAALDQDSKRAFEGGVRGYVGCLAKFLRMKLFHEFLFYLIYDHPVDAHELGVNQLSEIDVSGMAARDLTPIYSDTNDWKMFVPPLNRYECYPAGWVLMTDIMIRMPLWIFCSICTFAFYTKELDYYLDHPIRRNYLLKQLPKTVRAQLFINRRYIQNIFELTKLLCYAGLVQMGPQRMKDRDQTFIYLNRNICIMDTIESSAGYNEIEDRDYPSLQFYFANGKEVLSFWAKLYDVAVKTKLNVRSTAVGKEVYVQTLNSKPDMIEALRVQTVDSAAENDIPKLPPGDRKGAAGMDTAMFVHLKSNWHKTMNYAEAVHKQALKVDRYKTVRRKLRLKPTPSPGLPVNGKGEKLTEKKLSLMTGKAAMVRPFPASKIKKITKRGQVKMAVKKRTVKPRTQKKAKRTGTYDEVDRHALKLMSKLRVQWNRSEDNLLLLCRLAVMYLYGVSMNSSIPVNSLTFRDILHWSDPASLNKTSRACQRRLNYMVKKNSGVADQLRMNLEESRLNTRLNELYGTDFIPKLKLKYPNSENLLIAVKIHFVELVYQMRRNLTKFNPEPVVEVGSGGKYSMLPRTVQEFYNRFQVIDTHHPHNNVNYREQLTSLEDLHLYKLSVLIHSAIMVSRKHSYYNVQLFNIYRNYSERVLSNAVRMVRDIRLVSISKFARKNKTVLSGNLMPPVDNPYHVSIAYQQQLLTSIPFEMYVPLIDNYLQLLDREDYEEYHTFADCGNGLILLLGELITSDRAEVLIEPPVDYIVMDPEMKDEHPEYGDKISHFRDIYKSFHGDRVLEPLAKKSRTEVESSSKLRFTTVKDVIFNYVMHPIERLTKLPTEYFHFFCLLTNLDKRILVQTFKIDETYNVCTLQNCIVASGERDLIPHCLSLANRHREQISRIKELQKSHMHMRYDHRTAMFLVREDNLVTFYNRLMQDYQQKHTNALLRDTGRLSANFRNPLNILDLVDEILRFDVSTEDFNWLDRYEVTKEDSPDEEDEDGVEIIESSRDELSEKVFKLHNFYVVMPLKLHLKLRFPSNGCQPQLDERLTYGDHRLPCCFLPPSAIRRHEIMQRITSDSLWPTQQELSPLLAQVMPVVSKNHNLTVLLTHILQGGELGVTAPELLRQFPNRHQLAEDLRSLMNFKLVMRTGYGTLTYVHWQFIDEWVIKTTVIDRDARKASYVVSVIDENQAGPSTSSATRHTVNADDSEDDMIIEQDIVEEDTVEVVRSKKRKLEREIVRVEQHVQDKPKKPIWISITPWTRIDGAVNKRILYRWLSTLMLYLVAHPGVLLSTVYTRFNLMAPVHLRYLIGILEDYGCLTVHSLGHRPQKTLFSTYTVPNTEPATDFDDPDYSYVDPISNALCILSLCIGNNKKYTEDFFNTIRSKKPDEADDP